MLARIKKNDLVMVISGKDKGTQGHVIAIDRDNDSVQVKGVAIVTRHKKASGPKQAGGIVREERFIPACKVMPVCPESKKPCRVKVRINQDGSRTRVSHRSQAEL